MAFKRQMVLLKTFCVFFSLIYSIDGLYEFNTPPSEISKRDLDVLKTLNEDQLLTYLQLGCEAIDRQSQLEENLINSQITVKNGSISHVDLLERLPNKLAQHDNEVALKILKSSLYVLNSKCLKSNVDPKSCAKFLSETPLPKSELREECNKIIKDERDGHHAFRRLLPRNYKDSFYEMYSRHELPLARLISSGLRRSSNTRGAEDVDNSKNLVLIQWAQFIEHDLSKTVARTMKTGHPIECCNADNLELNPRSVHPACAPLIGMKSFNKYGPESCLNYVRSALAVGSKCNFNMAEQLNQATGYFDLSQLYGFTKNAQSEMRKFSQGQLKSTKAENSNDELLPMADDLNAFCAVKITSNASCYMAGDSRVNSNPFSIIIYTIFLRSHNHIAIKLQEKYPKWDDEQLYKTAKQINIAIYRQIIFNEWLPIALGHSIANTINNQKLVKKSQINQSESEENRISNEFAIAAIRFYFSMMPNALHRIASSTDRNEIYSSGPDDVDTIPVNLFLLKDQLYKPIKLLSNSNKINRILYSMLNQRAMKMDSSYVDSFTEEYMGALKPTRSDILAFDIQRGRDHGLQGYIKYLEMCEKTKINEWSDLERYIQAEDVAILKSLYSNMDDIDLIVGGISEIPVNGSTVGSTFTCILGEQFWNIRQWQHNFDSGVSEIDFLHKNWTAAKLICANTGIHEISRNVFEVPSSTNPLISCSMLLKS